METNDGHFPNEAGRDGRADFTESSGRSSDAHTVRLAQRLNFPIKRPRFDFVPAKPPRPVPRTITVAKAACVNKRPAKRVPLGALRPLPTKAELDQRLIEWSRNGMPFPRASSAVDLFAEQVQLRPKATALVDSARELDFATLDRLSNRVANRLRREGLKPEDIVALPLERSCAYVIAALGTLKAGGSYLPMDLSQPDPRLIGLLVDSRAKFAFAAQEHANRFSSWEGMVIPLDDAANALANESESPVPVSSDPKRRAYVIYTSGSTGQPKGVEIEHHSLTNLIFNYQQWLKLSHRDRKAVLTNIAFDASVADLWPYLCAGCAILIGPKQLELDPDGLILWLAVERVTCAFVPTALAEVMLTRPWPKQMALRFLATAGDTLHTRPPVNLPFLLINEYGPTENTVDAAWAVVAPGEEKGRPSIGRPIGNVKAYVLDDDRCPVQPGSEGELYLGGEQVARGYLNQPELTAEKFLPDPFAGKAGARMYRTGDFVRLREDGELHFLGRRDNQVQIRGRRVELAEIEQTVLAHHDVSQACCEPLLDGPSTYGIAAHVATQRTDAEFVEVLRKHCTERLPPYMVPRAFAMYERLPVNSRGKIDHDALRKTGPAMLTAFEASLPEGSPERALANLWFQMLPAARDAALDATFESVGGDSLHAVKLMLGVEEITGRRIPLSTFLVQPTLPGFLQVALSYKPGSGRRIVPLRAVGSRPPIFCLYGLDGDVYHYLELSRALGEDQPVFGIRSLGLDDLNNLPQSMEDAGGRALRWIHETTSSRTPVLVGYSWGGLLAFEAARQWQQAHGEAPLVIMIGTSAPRRRTTAAYRVWHFCRWLPRWIILKSKEGFHHPPAQMLRQCVNFFRRDPAYVESIVRNQVWARSPVAEHLIKLGDRYQPAPGVPIPVHLIRETLSQGNDCCHPLESSFTDHEPDYGWKRWAGRAVQVRWINTDHDSIIRLPAVKQLAESIRELMDAGTAMRAEPRIAKA